MHPVFINAIANVSRQDWNGLIAGDQPFIRYEFLHALEENGCVAPATGWQPHHLLLRSNGQLLAAMPLYIKSHSWGEYVFDWAWADAYQRHGVPYYPKLVCAIPFTPVSGARLLVAPRAPDNLRALLVRYALAEAQRLGVSSAHWLFADEADQACLHKAGLMARTGHQFKWRNRAYVDFAAFLDQLSARKRKNIRQERRRVAAAGIETRMLPARALDSRDWERFYGFYRATLEKKGAIPYLSPGFFTTIADTLSVAVRLAVACRNGEMIAAALFLEDHDALYGRYWGCVEFFDALHFELCYYRPIEYCIEHGLQRFEAGAQGEHKLPRGLLPVPTHSYHWLSHPGFADAIATHLEQERAEEMAYRAALDAHSPFRRSE